MTFSVIIPTYNRSSFLTKCLESLCEQSFTDFEVIICDDGSTDNTMDIVNKFKAILDLKYLYINNTGGPAIPRNEGVKQSVGKWLCFLDADDYWYKDKLKVCFNYIDKADIIYHDMIIEDLDGSTKGLYRGRNLNTKDVMYDLLINFNPIATSSLCIKREIFMHIGWFDYRFIEDIDYWLRASKVTTNFKYIPENLGVYVEHNSNSSHTFIVQANRLKKLYLKHSKNLDSKMKINNAIKAFHYQAGCLYEKAENYKGAISHFSKSIFCLSLIIRAKSLYKIIKYYGAASKSN